LRGSISFVPLPSFAPIASGLAPEPSAPRARALPGRPLAEDDPAFGKIVGGHLDMDPIAHHRADAEPAHLASGIGNDPVPVVEHDAETAVGHDLVDLAFEGEQG